MEKPVLVIMAAGMGSRYGGLKQIDEVDDCGNILIDYSIYDAKRAGFESIVFIIKHEFEDEFKEKIGNRISKIMNVTYVYQELDVVPKGYEIPKIRTKPWGTGHAIMCCKDVINGPFAVINADDYYGKHGFELIYNYLKEHPDNEKYQFTMVGYHLKNTVTENGFVSRGICEVNEKDELIKVTERTHIEVVGEEIKFTEDEGKTWTRLDEDSIVSMNLWGFTKGIMEEIEEEFNKFLETKVPQNVKKAEFFLPEMVTVLLEEGKADVKVLKSPDKWYGMTYKEDKVVVVDAIKKMKEEGVYPENLWEEEK